ncbi:hypothetical protein [Aquimarina sp. 2304DJ70-9]|uniref:hypothetical protein n=1 Tax=Aquimarina penaris TaxID=3231044 RepID=UPI0034625748
MVAEAIFPIVESLSKDEQLKLFQKLEKDLKSMEIRRAPKKMTAKQQRKAERIKWLKQNIFYPPK